MLFILTVKQRSCIVYVAKQTHFSDLWSVFKLGIVTTYKRDLGRFYRSK